MWVIFALLDPDPLALLNTDPIRIRIRNPALIGAKCCACAVVLELRRVAAAQRNVGQLQGVQGGAGQHTRTHGLCQIQERRTYAQLLVFSK